MGVGVFSWSACNLYIQLVVTIGGPLGDHWGSDELLWQDEVGVDVLIFSVYWT